MGYYAYSHPDNKNYHYGIRTNSSSKISPQSRLFCLSTFINKDMIFYDKMKQTKK